MAAHSRRPFTLLAALLPLVAGWTVPHVAPTGRAALAASCASARAGVATLQEEDFSVEYAEAPTPTAPGPGMSPAALTRGVDACSRLLASLQVKLCSDKALALT